MSRTRKVLKASYECGVKAARARDNHLVRIGRYEDLPLQASMRRSWRSTSTFDCTYLHRFLESNCGRPWDEVWSEFCKKFDSRTDSGREARETVLSYVKPRWWSYWRSFMVVDGVLTKRRGVRAPWRCRNKVVEEPSEIKINETSAYMKLNGIWYLVEFAPIPCGTWRSGFRLRDGTFLPGYYVSPYYYDVVLQKSHVASSPPLYAYKKTQLGKHKLKELKVKND